MCDVISDFFDERYFKLMRFFACRFGAWPFLPKTKQIRLVTISIVLLWCGMGNMMIAPFTDPDDYIETTLQMIPPVVTIGAITLKYCNLLVHGRTLKELFTNMYGDHVKNVSTVHLPILRSHSEKGRVVMHFYTYFILISMSLFLLFPYTPIFIDVLSPLNESRPRNTIFPAEYGVDIDKIYPFVMIHQSIHSMMTIFLSLCADTIMIALIFHSCGLFAISGYQMQHFADDLENPACSYSFEDSESPKVSINFTKMCNSKLIRSLELHIKALDFAERIRLCFTNCLCIVVVLNMIIISITFFQVVLRQGQWEVQITATIYTLGQFVHLFFLSLNGQVLNSVSEEVRDSIYDCHWYNLPVQTQKMIIFALMKAEIPSYITGGPFFILRMDTFSALVQTSMSYFMVLLNST